LPPVPEKPRAPDPPSKENPGMRPIMSIAVFGRNCVKKSGL